MFKYKVALSMRNIIGSQIVRRKKHNNNWRNGVRKNEAKSFKNVTMQH